MGNLARYWFNGMVLATPKMISWLKKELPEENYELEEMTGYNPSRTFLTHIFVEETNIGWKDMFEHWLQDNNIPYQKWMQG